jgi:hypothetical protein
LSNNNGFSEHPQITAYGNNVYVVWADDTFMNREILLSKSKDDGTSFGNIVNISDNLGDSFNQEIAAYGNVLMEKAVYYLRLDVHVLTHITRKA